MGAARGAAGGGAGGVGEAHPDRRRRRKAGRDRKIERRARTIRKKYRPGRIDPGSRQRGSRSIQRTDRFLRVRALRVQRDQSGLDARRAQQPVEHLLAEPVGTDPQPRAAQVARTAGTQLDLEMALGIASHQPPFELDPGAGHGRSILGAPNPALHPARGWITQGTRGNPLQRVGFVQRVEQQGHARGGRVQGQAQVAVAGRSRDGLNGPRRWLHRFEPAGQTQLACPALVRIQKNRVHRRAADRIPSGQLQRRGRRLRQRPERQHQAEKA